MNIGIIGAGNIGATLVRKLTRLGHSVKVANSRGPQTLTALSHETGAQAVTVEDAVRNVQVIVVTIPQKNIPDLPKGLFADLDPKTVVIDTGNYYPNFRDPKIEEIEAGTVESEWVANQIGFPVVKAFNNIFSGHLADKGQPKGSANRIALPVAGDNPASKEVVLGLIDELGFDAVDAGTLSQSWRQQPGTPVYCLDLRAPELKEALAKADRKRAVEVRDLTIGEMKKMKPGDTVQKIIDFSRSNYPFLQ